MKKTEQEKIEEIEGIYLEFQEKLAGLRCERNEMLDELVGDLERIRMEELRKKLQQI